MSANRLSPTSKLPSVDEVPARMFKDHQGQAIHFRLCPCSERSKLKPFVLAGGGQLNYGPPTDQTINLVAPSHIAQKDLSISSHYLWASIRAGRMVSMAAYQVPRGMYAPLESPEASVISEHESFSRRQRGRTCYTSGDDAKIVEFLTQAKHSDFKSLNHVAKEISKTFGDRHSWESVKNRISRHILPKFSSLVDSETFFRVTKLLGFDGNSESSQTSTNSGSGSDESGQTRVSGSHEVEKGKENTRIAPGDERKEESYQGNQEGVLSESGTTRCSELASDLEDSLTDFYNFAAACGLDMPEAAALLRMTSGQVEVATRVLCCREDPADVLWSPEADGNLMSGSREKVCEMLQKFGEKETHTRLRFLEDIEATSGCLESDCFLLR